MWAGMVMDVVVVMNLMKADMVMNTSLMQYNSYVYPGQYGTLDEGTQRGLQSDSQGSPVV